MCFPRKDTIHVLLVSVDNPYIREIGGKHVHLLLLERGLRSLGVQVSTLYYRKKKGIVGLLKRKASTVLPGYVKTHVALNGMMNYLRDKAPKREFDLIHAHDVLSVLATRSMPKKRILTLHGYFARENLEWLGKVSYRAEKEIYSVLLGYESEAVREVDYLIAVDNRLRQFAISELGYPKDRITVVHNSVDTGYFHPVLEETQKGLKRSLGYRENDFVVLVPRRLVRKNGVIYAVRALRNAEKEDIKMVIAGDGPEKGVILDEIGNDRRMRLIGSIPHREIDIYYKMADAILIPSVTSHGIQEATSLAMLEGMSCGKVVICSNIGGMREAIRNMENGILVEEKDPIGIARALQSVHEDGNLRIKIAKKARAYALQNHSFLVHAAKIAQIYKKVLDDL